MQPFLPKIDHAQFRKRCLADPSDFFNEGEVRESKAGFHIFRDNGAELLAVAHLDTVCDYGHYYKARVAGQQVVFNAQLDDRLGAYLLLDYLPALNVKYDILLTENEELCNSTAQDFVTEKSYKWLFQFDRAGSDVVLYQYESKRVRELLEGVGWKVGLGSYTDICELGHLKTCGINFGCGYQENHLRSSHVVVADIYANVRKFLRFYNKYQHKVLPVPKDLDRRWKTYTYQGVVYTSADWEGDDLVWERARVQSKLDDDLSNFDRCSGCNKLTRIDKMYWYGSDGYCATCVDASRPGNRSLGSLDDLCADCGHAAHVGYCTECQCFIEATIEDDQCSDCLAPHKPGELVCKECGYQFVVP